MKVGSKQLFLRLMSSSVQLDSEEARSALLQSLMDQVLEGPSTKVGNLDLSSLAQRELPPGSWGHLFVIYQAHCIALDQKVASKALFYKVSKPWRKVLAFRRRSQHSTCAVCDKLRARMRHARTFIENAKAADCLLGHLATVWRCREVYWEARQQSRNGDELLTLIIDGFDRSKPLLPRWTRGRTPKHSTCERVTRTGVQLSAVIAHGHGVVIFLTDEATSCGGSYSWETILFTLNEVWKQCCRLNKPFSRSLLGLCSSSVISLIHHSCHGFPACLV